MIMGKLVTSAKGFTKETDARILIDRRLKEAGWDIEDKNQVSTEDSNTQGRTDYILRDRRGRSVGLIEAKRFTVDPVAAKAQALKYAEETGVDFIFLSNGEEIYFWDYKNRAEQQVTTFFSQRDLEKIRALHLQQKPLTIVPVPDKYFKGGEWRTVRPYQLSAMAVMDKALLGGKRKMLLMMATGTGKTDLMALYLRRLFESGMVSRALFLVDRIDLGQQAKDVFDELLKEYPSKLLYGGKQKDESSIIISTLQTLYSQLPRFTSGYFDVVISDEAHRSIFGVYNAVLSHFDAIRIGLTATPSMYIDRNTYKLFGCWDELEKRGRPTFVYGIRNGIKEKFLAGYDIVQIDTKVSLKGVQYQGEDYEPEDLERHINVPARNEQITKAYRSEEEKRPEKRNRKAIVFAVTKHHAAQLAYYLNQEYPEYKGRFAEIITSDVEDPRAAIRRFKLEEFPVIAVSVGMLDTGIDAPMVENLLMVRPTRSPMLYQQMRGRGSRLYPKIGKTMFRIYDFVGVTKYYNDEGYNPYSEIEKGRMRVPWGVEEDELDDIPDKERERLERQFIQIPETAPENIDIIVQRAYVEVGPEGERIDADDYQVAWEHQVNELANAEPLIAKVRDGQELTNEEMTKLSAKLNSPKYFFNEANLREAYAYPPGTLSEFIKTALKLQELPTEEQLQENRISELFESWLLENNFPVEKAKILRLIKNQYVVRKEPIDVSIFNEPMFNQIGGLNFVLGVFAEKELEETLNDLNSRVFVKQ